MPEKHTRNGRRPDIAKRKRTGRPWNADLGMGSENRETSEATDKAAAGRDMFIRDIFTIYRESAVPRDAKASAGRWRVPKDNLARRGCTYECGENTEFPSTAG